MPRSGPWSYAVAVGIIALAFAIRLAFHSALGSYFAYTAFYPAVVIAAYVGGVGPAVLAAVIAAPLGYLGFSGGQVATEGLAFFALSSSVAIFLMNAATKAKIKLEEQRRQAQALAAGNAELFRELNERTANHLQLLAGLLRVESRGQDDPAVAYAFAEASIRTLQISRVHRGLVEDEGRLVGFDAFARLLLNGSDVGGGAKIALEPSSVRLPTDKATSVAVVLLECLNAGVTAGPEQTVRVELTESGGAARLDVTYLGEALAPDSRFQFSAVASQLIRAMTDQLGGRFSTTRSERGLVHSLVFPTSAPPAPQAYSEPVMRPTAPIVLH